MKKRLRKKLHLKEFAIYGFDMHVHCDFLGQAEENARMQVMLEQMCDLLEANGWKCGWECGGAFGNFFIYEGKPGQGIREKKDAFVEAMKQIPGVVEVHAHDIVDAWAGADDDCCCGDDGCECCGDDGCECGQA